MAHHLQIISLIGTIINYSLRIKMIMKEYGKKEIEEEKLNQMTMLASKSLTVNQIVKCKSNAASVILRRKGSLDLKIVQVIKCKKRK